MNFFLFSPSECQYLCIFFKALTRETKLKDIKDKELLSLHVFSHSIEYLKKNCLEKFKKQDYQECMDGILWVLTVPAIWDDAAKQFMREAAIEVKVMILCLFLSDIYTLR